MMGDKEIMTEKRERDRQRELCGHVYLYCRERERDTEALHYVLDVIPTAPCVD